MAVLSFFLGALPVYSADFPRSVAIAPFTSLTKEDIQQTVSILPRLLSSRLMALTGAEVVLLPSGEKPAAEAAREAKTALLLQGTVVRMGKGYSIDVTALDLGSGKTAGAFFAVASTEDDIIPQLGGLAAEISAKLFGVGTAVRPRPGPAAAALPVVPPPAPPAASAPAVRPSTPPPGPATAAVPTAVPTANSAGLEKAWVPTAMKKLSQSDKIVDELYGVVAGDMDEDGNGEVIAYGTKTLYIYRVKGTEITPYTRIKRGSQHHILNVETFDVDGDGKKEILVTDLVGENMESFILKRKGDVYEEVAGKLRYFLVVLPDWMGKRTVVGQRQGLDAPFQGKLVMFRWDGKGLVEGETLPHNTDIFPLSWGVPGLSSARLGEEWRLVYIDEAERLRVVGPDGKSEYRSKETFGTGVDFYEWGPFVPLEGSRKRLFLRKAVRVSQAADNRPLFLVPEVKRGVLNVTAGSYDSTRLVLLQWEDADFVERAGTPKSAHFYSAADILSPSGLRGGGKVVASAIEQMGGVAKDAQSRLVLFRVE